LTLVSEHIGDPSAVVYTEFVKIDWTVDADVER
jgi:hypothetical protein